ncbi:MAG: hypothetical protein M0Z75_10590 [Nitrospiraceae bacterium]|nr:hypothetical protein [Nitrospiraceae bacterium]
MKKLFAVAVVLISMLFVAVASQAADKPPMAGGGCCPGCNCPMMKGGGMMGMGGMMGKGMMGHPMMEGMMEKGQMMGGLPAIGVSPMYSRVFKHAMMQSMIRNALQDPEVKGFLDSTAPLRKELVEKRFEYFEAFRNPATPAAKLQKMMSEIHDLENRINAKVPAGW